MNKLLKFFLLGILVINSLTGCHSQPAANEIRLGVISGPESDLAAVAQQVALSKYGVKIDLVEFTDYTMPNTALNDGSLDANMFQHQPYLEQVIKNKGYALTPIGKTFIYPMGVYSQKVKTIAKTPVGAVVAIPNDPSNETRALLLLKKAGLITLKPQTNSLATILDITNNPKKLSFKELDAAQLARALPDVTLAVINTNYAIPAGLLPSRDAIYLEDVDSPYANLIVVKTADVNNPKFKALVAAFHSPQVIQAAKKIFNGAVIPAS